MASVSEKKLQHQSSTPKKLDIHYLKTITKNFSEDQILGRGGYGIVYKGEQENGEVVAVKRLIMSMAGRDDTQLMNEVQHAMEIWHPNIVRLEGYCYHTETELALYHGNRILVDEVYRLLCFEYLPNGSLDKYLSDESSGLDWHTRYNIIEGICMGLYCLHEGRVGAPIIHLDLKPSNILLDKNMIPKIADFGLSRLFDGGKTHTCTTNVIGTRGYMAPEYIDSFILSKESDIFSLGVIIVEIVTGHRKYPEGTSNEEFVEVYEKWRTRLQKTSNKTSLEEKCRQVDQCIKVGLNCMEKDPKKRPNIKELAEILKIIELSVKEDGFDGEEQSGKSMHLEWRETLDIHVSGSSNEVMMLLASLSPPWSIEAVEAVCLELDQMDDTLCVIPEYIVEDVDQLVSCLILMVQKTFSTNIAGSSSRHRKYTVYTLLRIVRIRPLARALKWGTLEELVTEMLIWYLSEEVAKMNDASQLNKLCHSVVVEILMAIMPSCTQLDILAVKNNRFSDSVGKYLSILKKDLGSTIKDLDLRLILRKIHDFLEQVGAYQLHTRSGQIVVRLLGELVKILGPKIERHLSMVPIDAEDRPLILTCIDILLKKLAEARMSVAPTDQTSHVASSGTKPSTGSPSNSGGARIQKL